MPCQMLLTTQWHMKVKSNIKLCDLPSTCTDQHHGPRTPRLLFSTLLIKAHLRAEPFLRCLLQWDLQKPHVASRWVTAEMNPPCGSDRDADLLRAAGCFINVAASEEHVRWWILHELRSQPGELLVRMKMCEWRTYGVSRRLYLGDTTAIDLQSSVSRHWTHHGFNKGESHLVFIINRDCVNMRTMNPNRRTSDYGSMPVWQCDGSFACTHGPRGVTVNMFNISEWLYPITQAFTCRPNLLHW